MTTGRPHWAVKHRLDVFGALVLSFAAGNAGGTARDLLIGAVPPSAIADCEGNSYPHPQKYALYRRGQSRTKPFCDGTHKRIGFDGTETASHEPFEKQAESIKGPTMVLEDAESLCAFGTLQRAD